MNKTEQGVLQQSKLIKLLHILYLITFCFSPTLYADTAFLKADQPNIKYTQHQHVALIYSADSTLQSEIAHKITQVFVNNNKKIHISEITSPVLNIVGDNKPDLIIAIGIDNIRTTNKYFNKTSKLLIASNPGEYTPVIKSEAKNTVLYMTQPYCRQIHFIKQINSQWKTFSYLSSQNNPVDDASIRKCADRYDMATYKVNTSQAEQLTNDLKNALSHSDLILALPDKTIYNSKTAKNILLTSYRNRKPVIAFSKSFVNAGALAAIHSNTEQIAQSVCLLIEQYYEMDLQFKKQVNYPQSFNISINRQVFRALDLPIPDVEELKQVLESSGPDHTGGLQ